MAQKKPAAKKITNRAHTRFRDDDAHQALINGKIPALAFSESLNGCGLVVLGAFCPVETEKVRVKVGNLGELKGTVRWRKDIDGDVAKIGIEFEEKI